MATKVARKQYGLSAANGLLPKWREYNSTVENKDARKTGLRDL